MVTYYTTYSPLLLSRAHTLPSSTPFPPARPHCSSPFTRPAHLVPDLDRLRLASAFLQNLPLLHNRRLYGLCFDALAQGLRIRTSCHCRGLRAPAPLFEFQVVYRHLELVLGCFCLRILRLSCDVDRAQARLSSSLHTHSQPAGLSLPLARLRHPALAHRAAAHATSGPLVTLATCDHRLYSNLPSDFLASCTTWCVTVRVLVFRGRTSALTGPLAYQVDGIRNQQESSEHPPELTVLVLPCILRLFVAIYVGQSDPLPLPWVSPSPFLPSKRTTWY